MKRSRVVEKTGNTILAVIHDIDSYFSLPTWYLVQCNDNEESCCFPGGTIRFGENPAQAISRELQEQYGLEIRLFYASIVHQSKSLEKQSTSNPATFFQQFTYPKNSESDKISAFQNQKYKKTKLRWCSTEDLYEQSIYSMEILDSIFYEVEKELDKEGSADIVIPDYSYIYI
jgi:8-oxo-dGTP pyrophosphatase MutT (NUDIX family)